jgi:hypothetical protein
MTNPVFPINFDVIRAAIAQEIKKVCLFDEAHVRCEEVETQNVPRPKRPYMSFKIIGPADKNGDDSYDNIVDTTWNTGGVRKMTISFHCYGKSHEEAYNYMSLWQAALGTEPILEDLRAKGIAVWIIGNVADLSILLNTGYEGRSHMEVTFGIASNIVSDYGRMEHVTVNGTINDSVETSNTI